MPTNPFALIGILLLTFLAGYGTGRIVDTHLALPPPEMRLAPDERPLVPTVVLERIRDGQLAGTMTPGARLFIGKTQVGATPLLKTTTGAFTIAAGRLAKPERSVTVPEGMHFVASKRGQKFYPILSTAAQHIAPENRRYFANADAAKAAGYRE